MTPPPHVHKRNTIQMISTKTVERKKICTCNQKNVTIIDLDKLGLPSLAQPSVLKQLCEALRLYQTSLGAPPT